MKFRTVLKKAQNYNTIQQVVRECKDCVVVGFGFTYDRETLIDCYLRIDLSDRVCNLETPRHKQDLSGDCIKEALSLCDDLGAVRLL